MFLQVISCIHYTINPLYIVHYIHGWAFLRFISKNIFPLRCDGWFPNQWVKGRLYEYKTRKRHKQRYLRLKSDEINLQTDIFFWKLHVGWLGLLTALHSKILRFIKNCHSACRINADFLSKVFEGPVEGRDQELY